MSTKVTQPSVDEIKSLETKCLRLYDPVYTEFDKDDEFYELKFGARLYLPEEAKTTAILLPTARNRVDVAVDHTDLSNARVGVQSKGSSKAAMEAAQMLRRFGQGVLYMTNVQADISPWRVAGKFFWLYGLAPIQVLYDGDVWPDKPIQGDGKEGEESDEEYAIRLEEWRAATHDSLPIVIRAINPHNIMPDPSYGGRRFVIERHKKMVYDIMGQWPAWKNAKGIKVGETVDYMSYWDGTWRYAEADGQPLLPGETGVIAHKYGFLPYAFIETGLGNFADDGDLSKRYVGILRYFQDILAAESRGYSLSDASLRMGAFAGPVLEGELANSVTEISQEFGKATILPAGVKWIRREPNIPPEALRVHTMMLSQFVSPPATLMGLGETGVRSGADRQQVRSEAGSQYRYASEAFRFGAAKVLSMCARILKNVIPGDVRVWARTPVDEFDVIIEKDKLKEPFTFEVEFAPISEMDEYRRDDNRERLVSAGIVSRRWARGQKSNVDSDQIERDLEREKLMNDPMLQPLFSQYAAGKLMAAIARRQAAEGLASLPAAAPAAPPPASQPQEPGRRLVPPIPERAAPGSAEAMELDLKQLRSQTPMSPTQGMGGGGNRP